MIRSKKTEHHIGKCRRIVPIFSDLLPQLRESFEPAADGGDYVISSYPLDSVNLRTAAHRIIKRAGLLNKATVEVGVEGLEPPTLSV